MNYAQAASLLQGRCERSRKLANNTYLERGASSLMVRLHSTHILEFFEDGSVRYNTGGWKTPVTKDRMNEFGPDGVRLCADRGIWRVRQGGYSSGVELGVYADGMVYRDGKLEGAAEDPKAELKQRKVVAAYAKRFVAALEAGEVPAPGLGDCMFCGCRVVDSKTPKIHHGFAAEIDTRQTLGESSKDRDHIDSHIEENYYVPSLLQRALEVSGASRSMWWWIGSWWDTTATDEQRAAHRRFSEKSRVEKALRKYLFFQLGMVR